MKPSERIRTCHDEFTAIRRDLHAHPELGFEEHRTARVVQEKLAALGIEHHTGIGKTGIVAVIPGTTNTQRHAVGLRADMDALPMQEENEFAHKSRYEGRMHGCGHDGHTTMLLAAAQVPARDAPLRRHRVLHLPAGRGGLCRRQGDDRGRALRALSRGAGVRAAQLAGLAAGPDRHHARPRDGRRRPHRDHDRRQGRPRRASARGDRSGARRRPHHHGRAIDRQPQREPDRHRGGEPVRDARRTSGRDERDPLACEARRHGAHVPAGDAGHDREAPDRARPVDRAPPSVRARRCITSASIRRRSTTTREAMFAADVAEALVGRDNVVRNLDAVDGRGGFLVHAGGASPAPSRGWGRAARRAAASCTTAPTISTTR